jgi:dethiobiotin synthetase
MKAFFVTATDTDVGKTFASCAMLAALSACGLSTLGVKPVAAGADCNADGWHNSDALALQRYASIDLDYAQVNPVLLREPASPHIAAALEGKRVSVDKVSGFIRGVLLKRPDFAIVEGAGGWRVPLNDREMLSDLAVALGLPVILVVPVRLGCINHACLAVEAIRRDGLPVAGWIANSLSAVQMDHHRANVDTLGRIIRAPLLAELPYLAGAAPEDAISYIKTQYLI